MIDVASPFGPSVPEITAKGKIVVPSATTSLLSKFGWTRHLIGTAIVWFRGETHGRLERELAEEAAAQSVLTIATWLDGLDGHFSLVVEAPDFAFAASDPIRSYPLVWAERAGQVLVTHDGPALEAALSLGPEDVDPVMARAVALSGFTVGNATLYPAVRQVGPGEYLWVEGGRVQQRRYHRWDPWRPTPATPGDLLDSLSALNQELIQNLVAGAAGRTILVPLSAGLDSRLIASGLKEAGYEKVRCVAYGLAGNREARTSNEIARQLGYDWSFISYTQRALRQAFHDPDYAAYKAYSDSLTGMHFPQEYRMLKEMRDRHGLEPDAIVVNGQTGDFIAGNHVPDTLFDPGGSPEARLKRIVEALLAKHYKNWRVLRTPERLDEIRVLLEAEIAALGGLPDDPTGDHGIYEYCEFQDRQSKYVLNGQRTYEYFGHHWRLPLWDRAYMNFWARAPLAAKRGESLYRRVLERDNWGGVWRDIPVNPLRVRPGWLRPLRALAKAAHAPLGRGRWRRFEKRYLEYWMAATCAYAAWPYGRVAADRRGHASATAWHAADYLIGKGLTWDGSRPGATP